MRKLLREWVWSLRAWRGQALGMSLAETDGGSSRQERVGFNVAVSGGARFGRRGGAIHHGHALLAGRSVHEEMEKEAAADL